MSKSDIKILQYKQNTTPLGDDVLSEEDLINIEDDNDGNDDVDESSSDIEEMQKILKTGKKRGRRAQREYQHVNDLVETICENEYFRRKLIFTNNKLQKNKEVTIKLLKNLTKCVNPISF